MRKLMIGAAIAALALTCQAQDGKTEEEAREEFRRWLDDQGPEEARAVFHRWLDGVANTRGEFPMNSRRMIVAIVEKCGMTERDVALALEAQASSAGRSAPGSSSLRPPMTLT
jgi:Xaa-Pro aminopeptidase